jgi:hypothetical protein
MATRFAHLLLNRLFFAVVTAALLSVGSAARLYAGTTTIGYRTPPGADGTLTFLTDPNGPQPAADSLLASSPGASVADP